MQVFLDDRPLETDATTLTDALESARGAAESEGRLIVDVLLDNEPLDESQIVEAAEYDLGAAELKCYSVEPYSFVRQTFDQVVAALDQISALQRDTAEKIQAGDLKAAMEQLGATIELWDHAQMGVQGGAALVGLDLDAVRTDDGSITEAIQELADRLRDIRSAVESGDWVALSDCLGYEMGPVSEQWRGMLNELSRRVETAEAESKSAGESGTGA
ncbi:MAG: hypothetical protein ACF8PN_01460 [Phycisphaerales bacterium]